MSKIKSYVAGFLFSETGGVVALVRKKRPDWQANSYNGIGGKVEDGESPHMAMVREFQEEAGILIPRWNPLVRLYRPGVFEVWFFFAKSDQVYNVKTMTDEEVAWHPVTDLRKLPILPSLKWLVPLALDRSIGHDAFLEIQDKRGHA